MARPDEIIDTDILQSGRIALWSLSLGSEDSAWTFSEQRVMLRPQQLDRKKGEEENKGRARQGMKRE